MPGEIDSVINLVSVADAKEYLKIGSSETSEDSILAFLINEVSKAAEGFAGRPFKQRSWTEYYNGNDRPDLILRVRPVTAVSSLNIDSLRNFSDSTAIDVSANVIVKADAGILTLWNTYRSFGCGQANVKVVYTGGYTPIPYDLQHAAKSWVAWAYEKYREKRHGMASHTVGERTMTYVQEPPKDAREVIERYRELLNAPDYSHGAAT